MKQQFQELPRKSAAAWLRGKAWVIFSALCVVIALLDGCSVGPNYQRPSALGTNAMPAAFVGEVDGPTSGVWKPAEPIAHLHRDAWWGVFKDPELSRLEMLAAGGNQDLAVSLARFEQARAQVNIARAGYFPHIDAVPNMNRQRTSANAPDQGRPTGASYTYNTFNVPLDAGWEVDLWGRVRRQVEAARAQLAAVADDLEAVRLAIQAEVATDYFTLRAFDAERALLQQTVAAYQKSLELTRNRRKGGIVSDLDVSQAETQLETTESKLPAVDLQRAKLRHALATLCGRPATGFELATANTNVTTGAAVPVSLPSELLERRPDIAAAERRMASANAGIGVAQAAFYPRVTIGGLAGFQSVNSGTLFDWPSRVWAVGPSLDLPLFTGGRNRAQLAVTRAGYDETVAAYRQTVLNAFQEVEDQLAAQLLLAMELKSNTAALMSARRTLEIANNRYQAGLVTYLEVAIAQSAAFDREREVVRLSAERLAANVALIKALGGGWISGAVARSYSSLPPSDVSP